MYQLVERLIMQSPMLMGLLVLVLIFMYVRFILSLFKNWKEIDKKTKRNRLILMLVSPLVIWFIVTINASSLAVFDSDDESPKKSQQEINHLRIQKMMDSINYNYRQSDTAESDSGTYETQ